MPESPYVLARAYIRACGEHADGSRKQVARGELAEGSRRAVLEASSISFLGPFGFGALLLWFFMLCFGLELGLTF